MARTQKPLIGGVLYLGPSMLDGKPIVAIMTGFGRRSQNSKTGKMLQTWIMRADIGPAQMLRENKDISVCGDCPQRRNQGGYCYVVPEQAPLQVWRAWRAGRYADLTQRFPNNILRGYAVRFGSYGDPAAVPTNVWRRVLYQKIVGWTGYTHQWRDPRFRSLRTFLMASADGLTEKRAAERMGWRTFRVRSDDEQLDVNEISCPSDRVTCEQCRLCMGNAKIAKSIAIVAHGYLAKRRNKNKKQGRRLALAN